MTTHYIDIRLRPDPEFSQIHLLGALMAKLHRALVLMQASDIGVSFPEHVLKPRSRRGLGAVLRLHGTPVALNGLTGMDWLRGMRDHVDASDAARAPVDAPHRQVLRRQFKTNVDRLRRRRMRRKGETAEQATIAIPEHVERRPELPYVQARSSSTGQPFCLFVDHLPLQAEARQGEFNSYGLSRGATVPWF